jgi:hypothetical protein
VKGLWRAMPNLRIFPAKAVVFSSNDIYKSMLDKSDEYEFQNSIIIIR